MSSQTAILLAGATAAAVSWCAAKRCAANLRASSDALPQKRIGSESADRNCAQVSHLKALRPKMLFGQSEEACSEVALIDEQLEQLAAQGCFSFPGVANLKQYVQPASIDLPVSGKVYLVKEKVLPFQQRIGDLIEGLTLEEKSLSGNGAVLLKGQTYLIYCGRVTLPPYARGCLSPKSSIGRVDVMVRGVVDGCGLYDVIPHATVNTVAGTGAAGGGGGGGGGLGGGGLVGRELWLEISPRSFNVRVRDGVALTQMMVFMPWDKAQDLYPVRRQLAPTPADSDDELCAGRQIHVPERDSLSTDRLTVPVAVSASAEASNSISLLSAAGAGTGTAGILEASPAERSSVASEGGATSAAAREAAVSRPGTYDLAEERLCFDADGKALALQLHKGAVILSVRVPAAEEGKGERAPLAGYEALSTEEVIDLSRLAAHSPSRFFRPLPAPSRGPGQGGGGGRLTLEKDRFYILATKERVAVPIHLSAEMVPFSHHVGELRAHYAGFFDPGFGYGRSGEVKGTVGVLEVRPHETINIYDGQPICLMEFFRNSATPLRPYGFSGSNYQNQSGPKLAKFFAEP